MGRNKKNDALQNNTKPLKKVHFTLSAPEAQNVFLLGDFNGWETDPHSLKKDKKGNWKSALTLPQENMSIDSSSTENGRMTPIVLRLFITPLGVKTVCSP